jgi:hypothetical protein
MTTTDRQITEREIKALQIAAKSKLTQKGDVWLVPSQAGHGEYEVRPDPQVPRCTCPDHEYTQARCKHIYAVEYTLMRETTSDGATVVTETVKVTRKTYTQDWPAYNAAQTHEKSELQALLYELCQNVPEPEQRKGRGRPQLSLSDMIFSSAYKIYSTVSGRRFATDLGGFSTGQFMRWFDVKYGQKEDRRMWLKLHLMCGVKTNIVTSVRACITSTVCIVRSFYSTITSGLMSRLRST